MYVISTWFIISNLTIILRNENSNEHNIIIIQIQKNNIEEWRAWNCGQWTRSKEPIQSKKSWKYTTIIALSALWTQKLVWRTKESLLYYSQESSYGKSSVYTDIKIRRRWLNSRRLITDKINIFWMGRDLWNVPHTETPKQNTSSKTQLLHYGVRDPVIARRQGCHVCVCYWIVLPLSIHRSAYPPTTLESPAIMASNHNSIL